MNANLKNRAARYRAYKPGVLAAYRCERCQPWHVGHERAYQPTNQGAAK